MSEERLMTVVEVADMLQVDEQTVRRWIRQGRLAAHNLGGKAGYRVQRSDLQAFLDLTRGGNAPKAQGTATEGVGNGGTRGE